MLRHAHGPENTDTLGIGDHLSYLLQCLNGESADIRSDLERERLQALSVFFEIIDPLIEERRSGKAIVEQVAADGRKPDHVRARAWMKEDAGAPRHLMFPQV